MTQGALSILVVDDDARMRELIQWTLEDEGLEVFLASDGAAALDFARRSRPALVKGGERR